MTVTVLTPPGTGAIATVRVAGAGAWAAVRARFRPAGSKPLPDRPELHRVWFGTLGDGGDEVVLGVEQVEPDPAVALHCHGGRVVVAWVCGLFEDLTPRPPLHESRGGVQEGLALGGTASVAVDPERKPNAGGTVNTPSPFMEGGMGGEVLRYLPLAPTLRCASILLDQFHGAFDRAVAACFGDPSRLPRLAALAPVGRHLIEPWRVALAGPPNVGKSSLANALAGFERSVVAPVAGTTRDVVTVRVAFDGWPVELNDTAGLRDAAEELEAEGIARTRIQLDAADLVVWVVDATDPVPPPAGFAGVVVRNKVDLRPQTSPPPPLQGGEGGERSSPDEVSWLPVSAATGAGVPGLIGEIVRRLVPVGPKPGEGVPYTAALAELVETAAAAVAAGTFDTAAKLLRDRLG